MADDLKIKLGLEAAQYFSGMQRVQLEAKRAAGGLVESFTSARSLIAGIGGAAAITGLVNIAKETAAYGREVDQLAKLSNASTQTFQEWAYATDRLGVDQDKLSDILKDVNDKVGDFLQNGAGPLKDFFDNIAPKVGVTAEQFRSLSGPQALQLYVSSLEKANLSQSEMTFYMEAIASDSTKLLPLLRDNGAALQDMANEAHRLGVVMSEDAVQAAQELDVNMRQLEATSQALKMVVGNELIPVFTDLSNEFLAGMRHADGFWDALIKFGTINPFQRTSSNLADLRAQLESLRADRAEEPWYRINTKALDEDIARLESQIAYLQDISSAGIARSAKQLEKAYFPGETPAPVPSKSTGKSKPTGPTAADAKRYVDALKSQVAMLDVATVKERVLADIQLGRLDGGVALQKEQALRYAEEIDLQTKLVKIAKDRAAARAEAVREAQAEAEADRALVRSMLDATPTAQLERDRKAMQLLAKAFQDNQIDEAQYLEAVKARLDTTADGVDKVSDAAREMGLAMSSAFEQAVIEGKSLQEVTRGLLQDIAQMALRKAVTEPLAAGVSGWLSGILKFDGGGYTGEGARSGGMDGRGGFLAMLHPNETVIDHTRGQGGGVVVQQTINVTTGVQQTVRAEIMNLMPAIAAASKSAVADAKLRGGSFGRAMS